jgi:LPS-assembly protein
MLVLCLPAFAEVGMCPQLALGPSLPDPTGTDLTDALIAESDNANFSKEGIATLLGMVRIRKNGREFSAPTLNYDEKNNRLSVRTRSLLRSKNLLISSESVDFDLNAESGIFTGAHFVLPDRGARGDAARIVINSDRTASMDDAVYTTCAPGSDAWYLRASNITLNVDEGVGTATNTRLWLGKVPIFYTPWFQFPIDNRRQTGLLFPSFAQTQSTGLDIQTPLYVNLAPNYDLLLTPRLMSKRGVQLKNEFRYLFEENNGDIKFDYLSNDRVTNQSRRYLELQHNSQINRRLVATLNYQDASDQTYFEDLNGYTTNSSISYLDRRLEVDYQAPAAYTITTVFQGYQTITPNVLAANVPYQRLPQIRAEAYSQQSYYNTHLGFSGEFTNFMRADSLHGQRVDMTPYLRNSVDNNAWYAVSQLDLRYTRYELAGTTAGQTERPQRTLPTLSIESGLRFDRITANEKLQTLEPKLFYLYTPFRDQSDLPVFDTTLADFDAVEIFSRNRYLGIDRISDANHIAAAITSRLLEPDSGVVRMTATIGQIYRLTAPRVDLPVAGYSPPSNGSTDTIGNLEYQMSEHWSSALALQYSPAQRAFTRTNFGTYYNDETGRSLGLMYRSRQGVLEQTDVSAALPIFEQWRLSARWRFSLADSQTLESSTGVEYDTCCWAVRTSYRRFLRNTAGEYDSGVYLQLELKGLTRLRSGSDSGALPLLLSPVL